MSAPTHVAGPALRPRLPDLSELRGLDDDALLTVIKDAERAAAMSAALSVLAAGLLASRRRQHALLVLGPDASQSRSDEAAHEAILVVEDEIRLATGLRPFDIKARVRAGLKPRRYAPLLAALDRGEVPWARAQLIVEETDELPPSISHAVTLATLAPSRDGAAVPWGRFRQFIRATLARHVDMAAQREVDLAGRDVSVCFEGNGTADFRVLGSAERVQCATDRIDTIARIMRKHGAKRTLGQLRSDVTLDLLLHGSITPTTSSTPTTLITATAPGFSRR